MITGMRPFYGIPVYDARADTGPDPTPEDALASRADRPAEAEVEEIEGNAPDAGGTVMIGRDDEDPHE